MCLTSSQWSAYRRSDEKEIPYLFDPCGEVLHVPDRNGLVVRKVDLGLGGEEAVDLALGGELGREVLLVDLLERGPLVHDLAVVHRIG